MSTGTVAESVAKAWRATLPTHLAKSPLVDWVLSYAASWLGRDQESDVLDWRGRTGGRRGYLSRLSASILLRVLLRQRLPMYADALFAFGRPMRATELALRDITSVLQKGGLRAAASQIAAALEPHAEPQLVDKAIYDHSARLEEVAQLAIKHHQDSMARYIRVEAVWEREVGEFRDIVNKVLGQTGDDADVQFQPRVVEQVLDLQFRPSGVPDALTAAGLPVDREHWQIASPESVLTAVVPAIGLLLLGEDPELRWSRWSPAIEYLLARAGEAEFHRALAPRLAAEERALEARYGGVDPFARFDPGLEPPSPELIMAVNENRLSSDIPSAWLSRWQARLLTPDWAKRPLGPEESILAENVNWAALQADSVIKRDVTKGASSPSSLIADIQRSFEREWLQDFAWSLFSDVGGERQMLEEWTADELEKYLQSLIEVLNARGYSLALPSRGRLEKLLELARSNESRWTADAW